MTTDRLADTDRLYALLTGLEQRLGGKRTLGAATARSGWPSHGIYFFFEHGEMRTDGQPRVVRVGTHALTPESRTTLWQRLAQHRGHQSGSSPGGGNHRASVFRLHVGAALLRRDHAPDGLLASWLAKKPDPSWLTAVREHERLVSQHIGAMPFLWLSVPTRLDGSSDRGYLERNCIALLSTSCGGVDAASPEWLGHYAVNPGITRSSLWNVNHIDDRYTPQFLDVLEEYVRDLSD